MQIHPIAPDSTDTGPDLAARTGRPRDESREQAILDAAIDLVAEVGYERLTIEGVATRAHASKATIYRRWPGKAELVVDALRRRVAEPITIPDLGSLRAELIHTMQVVCAHIDGLDGNLLCGLAGSCQSDPELATCFKQMMDEKDSPMAAVVSRAVTRGELPEGASHALIEEVTPAVALMRALKGEPLDDAFALHLVDDISLPLLAADTTHPTVPHPATPRPTALRPTAPRPTAPRPATPLPPTGSAVHPAKESR